MNLFKNLLAGGALVFGVLALVLGVDAGIMSRAGFKTTAEVRKIQVDYDYHDSSSSRTIHLCYPGPGGNIINGMIGHRFSSLPSRPSSAGRISMNSGGGLHIAVPVFVELREGGRVEVTIHPDNAAFAIPTADLWIPTAIAGAFAVICLILMPLCTMIAALTPAPDPS